MGGRRRAGRRAGDARGCPLDWYPPSLLAAAVAILALSSLDAAFTLHLLEHDLAVEANPLMAALIESDVRLFVNLKTALTGTCIVLLVVYSETQLLGILTVGRCLHVLAAIYGVLIGYEIVLIGYEVVLIG